MCYNWSRISCVTEANLNLAAFYWMGDGRGGSTVEKEEKMGGSHQPKSPPSWLPQHEGGETPSPQGVSNSSASALAGGVQKATGFWFGGRELDSVAFGCSSLHSKPTGLLHCCQQLLIELFIGLIGRDVDPVKAGTGRERVTAGQWSRACPSTKTGRSRALRPRVRGCGRACVCTPEPERVTTRESLSSLVLGVGQVSGHFPFVLFCF